MEIEIVRSVLTVLSFVSFLGVVAWAYAPRRRSRFDQDAMMPFSQQEPAAACNPSTDAVPASTTDRGRR
jgi:cytochrome c oxidase cbb3-type subunit 4